MKSFDGNGGGNSIFNFPGWFDRPQVGEPDQEWLALSSGMFCCENSQEPNSIGNSASHIWQATD